jgi:hypothetical protein
MNSRPVIVFNPHSKVQISEIGPPERRLGKLVYRVVWTDGEESELTHEQLDVASYTQKIKDQDFHNRKIQPGNDEPISIENLQWIPDKIIDEDETNYFVKFQGWRSVFSYAYSKKSFDHPTLVQKWEEKKTKRALRATRKVIHRFFSLNEFF